MSGLIARVAGGTLTAFGIGLVILAIWIAERQIVLQRTLALTAAAIVIGFAALAVFCVTVGYRLMFIRPNRYGSLLSPAGWTVLAIGFCFISLLLILYRPSADHSAWGGVVGLVLLAGACLAAARNCSRQSSPSTVFPSETALMSLDGFMPPGFSSGVEILNDNRTPMNFVVSELQNSVGLSRSDAVRTMFAIHGKGGVLLPMHSLDESKRVANDIAKADRAKGYPLVCRSVTLE